MTRCNNIETATTKPARTSRAGTAWRLALMALLISMSLSACRSPTVINADQTLTRLPAGQTYTAPVDGWFLSDALYQRYRKAVADRILEEQTKPVGK
jgi:hypothetical protein